MRWLLTLVFVVSYLPQLGAQSVETVAQHRLINDGLWVDPAGVIYSGNRELNDGY